ncbi:MAG TPA: metallophosphoesterase [Planctomycetota bacterium]|nr:metallophosphoesterase [Planctomycetota bacterium]
MSRRGFLRGGCAGLAAAALARPALGAEPPPPQGLTFGVFADPQYGERKETIGRVYRDSPAKLAACIEAMAKARPAFVIGLGDFVDGTSKDPEVELGHLGKIEEIFRRFEGPRHHVLGNHDLDALTKEELLKATGMPAAHYAFDAPPFRCIVLDGCYRKDFEPYARGNFVWTDSWIPAAQLRWLEAELKKAEGKALVFVHQPLDRDDVHCVRNAGEVRRILEDSGKVVAVFSGHNHKGGYRKVRGIHYVTVCGMVEGPGLEHNAYALVTVTPAGALTIKGFGAQPSSTRE